MRLTTVSDIICEAAFGYKTDSLHNPHNELAEAYENLINLQSGPNMARMIAFMHIPGFAKLMGSKIFYKLRKINYWLPGICNSPHFQIYLIFSC